MPGQLTALYLRISNDQEGQELGVTRQYDDLLEESERAGDVVVGPEREVGGRAVRAYVDNDISASTLSRKRRPDYSQLLADAKAGRVHKIRAYTAARLTRRPREFEDLIDLATKHSVVYAYIRSPSFDLNTAQGRQVARTLAAGDAAYPEIISELVLRKKLQAKADGRWLGGGRPFGYEADGMTVRESEAELIRRATERILAGDSMRSIAEEWNAAGVLTATGREWIGNAVRDVLTRPRNAGLMGKGDRIEGDASWPAIVERDLWEALRAMVKSQRWGPAHSTSRKLLGSFLYRCECGELVGSGGTTRRYTNAAGKEVGGLARYRCQSGCGLQRIAEPVDKLVLMVAEADLALNGAGLVVPATDQSEALHKRLRILQARAAEIADAFGDPDIPMTKEQFKSANAPIQREISETEAELGRLSSGLAFSGVADAPDPVKAFRAQSDDRKRAIIDARWNVTLMRVGRGRRPFDPESVVITPKE